MVRFVRISWAYRFITKRMKALLTSATKQMAMIASFFAVDTPLDVRFAESGCAMFNNRSPILESSVLRMSSKK